MTTPEIRESPITYKISVICGKVAYDIDKDLAEAVGEENLKKLAEVYSNIREESTPLAAKKLAEESVKHIEVQAEPINGFSDKVYK